MNVEDYDWTKFRKQIFINADVEQVFRAWTVPEQLEQWFIARADYTDPDGQMRPRSAVVQSGDAYHWHWHQDLEATGMVLDVVDNERFCFTFGDKEPDSDEKIKVTATFKPQEDTTLLELVQENMAATPHAQLNWHMGCNLG